MICCWRWCRWADGAIDRGLSQEGIEDLYVAGDNIEVTRVDIRTENAGSMSGMIFAVEKIKTQVGLRLSTMISL